MNCRDIESLILAERDGPLSASDSTVLSDHVAACASCQRFRSGVTAALAAYRESSRAAPVPEFDAAWRDLRARREAAGRTKRSPLAPVIWFAAPLAAAAALAIGLFVARPLPSSVPLAASTVAVVPPPPPPVEDSSIIAGADFVEAGNPNASTIVYVDKDSGWLVVWAADVDASQTRG